MCTLIHGTESFRQAALIKVAGSSIILLKFSEHGGGDLSNLIDTQKRTSHRSQDLRAPLIGWAESRDMG